jgi:acetyl esterase/lipase
MSIEQVDRLRAMLLSRRGQTPALAERRAGFEAQMAAQPLPADVMFTPVAMPGVACGGLWVDCPDSNRDTILLWLHGGAFMLGSALSYRAFGAALARASGCRVLLLDYRLAPEHPFPAALDDSVAALDALLALSLTVAIGGDSCGANLATAAIQARLDAGQPPPRAAWLISPYLDLTHAGDSVVSRAARDPFIDPATMPATAQTYLAGHDPADPRASPLFGTVDKFPPTLIQVGSDELLFDDARRFAARLDACVFQEWMGMIHVWPLFSNMIDEGQWAIAQGGIFLQRHMF